MHCGDPVQFGSIPETGNDNKYWIQTCKTQFDYCLEEYAIEEYQDTGGIWEWVQIDTQLMLNRRRSRQDLRR
jgi:hypothetical protein